MRRIVVLLACFTTILPAAFAQAIAPAAPAEIPPAQLDTTLNAMPLLAARQNLLLARTLVLEGQYQEAIRPLLTAAQALAAFERQEPGPHGQDAEYTRQRIVEYTRVVAGDPSDALSRIDNWIDRISHWDGGK